MSIWVVVNHTNTMQGFASWDPAVDPPWPEKRGRLIPLNPDIKPPQVGDVIDDWCGPVKIPQKHIRKFLVRHGGWVVAAISLALNGVTLL